ncbi:serine hydrolase [Devosia sp. RR2S18]|uniref:serine hydrolase n=1 Tax=Devosia rhizosphaerae TaxID=3049774 RepID=UPI0025422536|nr:serine hydrolase [Devosia sp. RR2S18]WIJ25528.1 serine hydrolase [Devosia sp. RR2S18]
MKLIATTMAALLALGSHCFAQAAPMPADPTQILSDRLERDGQGTGIAAAVVEGGSPEFFSRDVLRVGTAVPISPQTVFEIGSVTKVFTSLLLAQMVLEGKMDLHAPVEDYLPERVEIGAFEGTPVTLFDLATHHSGLPRIPPELMFADPANPYAVYSEDMLYDFLAAYPLQRRPGERFEYSNLGVALLGAAISHTAGVSYGELLETRIFEPLGMLDSGLVTVDAARLASGHDPSGTVVPHWDFDVFAAAGGVRSTATDMARFVAAASGQTETPLRDAFELMLAERHPADAPQMEVGLGWMIRTGEGGEIIWHNGMTAGFNAFAGFAADGTRGSVVLANQITQTGIEDIGFHLIDPDLKLTPQPQRREAIEIDPALLQNYVGQYRLSPSFILTVTAEDGRLFVQATGQEQFEVFPETETEFFYSVVDAQISFVLGVDGKAKGLVLHQNGLDVPGERL